MTPERLRELRARAERFEHVRSDAVLELVREVERVRSGRLDQPTLDAAARAILEVGGNTWQDLGQDYVAQLVQRLGEPRVTAPPLDPFGLPEGKGGGVLKAYVAEPYGVPERKPELDIPVNPVHAKDCDFVKSEGRDLCSCGAWMDPE